MCGRTAITLCTEDVQCACEYKSKESLKFTKPEWRSEYNLGKSYKPSHNLAPTDVLPVLISASHFDSNENFDRLLMPMMWGMIPRWHKGDYKTHGLSTNNCRLENMLQSRLYSGPFKKGQRCVIMCEGFYEWQTEGPKNKHKTPYYIYMPQKDGVKIEDPNTWSNKWSEEEGWSGIELIKLAGLFDAWKNEEGDMIYSFSVITFEANDTIKWLHHRMPAILETEKQVSDWLDFDRVSDKQAIEALKPATKLQWHPVDSIVNNSRNKSDQCNKPISLDKKPAIKNTFMQTWLNQGTKRKSDSVENKDSEPKNKK